MRRNEVSNPQNRPQALREGSNGTIDQTILEIRHRLARMRLDKRADLGCTPTNESCESLVQRQRIAEFIGICRRDSDGDRFTIGNDAIEIENKKLRSPNVRLPRYLAEMIRHHALAEVARVSQKLE